MCQKCRLDKSRGANRSRKQLKATVSVAYRPQRDKGMIGILGKTSANFSQIPVSINWGLSE